MKKKKEELSKVVIDGTPYTILYDTRTNPLTEEAMIIFAKQLIILNEHEENTKNDMSKMDDLMHEIVHGVIHHRLANFRAIDTMSHEDQERLVQELGRGLFKTLIYSPQLLKKLTEISQEIKNGIQ